MVFQENQRVRVRLAKLDEWATGAPEKINGATGVVAEVKRNSYLVHFDKPVEPWHRNALSHASFHFEAKDLELE